jgi:Ni/Fe-hydrogenase 1 B-type cytochrome subunit
MSHAGHYREAHPLIFVITHWINLICMTGLAFTGFYIHYPFFEGFMGAARAIHFVMMFIITINLTARVILTFWVKTANQLGSREVDVDLKNWLPQEENKHQIIETMKYYLFMRKEHVISGKYGSPQKIAYYTMTVLTFVMAYTGFAIYTPAQTWGIWPFFSGGLAMVGGDMNMRLIHYFVMWIILLLTMVHAYLANIGGIAPSKIIFAWIETPGDEGH